MDMLMTKRLLTTYLEKNFSIYPVGPLGISEGSVTMTSSIAFDQLSTYLHNMDGDGIPGSGQKYYGILDVIDPRKNR